MRKGSKHSPESIQKISDSKKGAAAWNKNLTKEMDSRVAKYANTLTGRKLSQSTKDKIRKAKMTLTPERRSEIGRMGGVKSMAKKSIEEKRKLGKKASMTFINSVPYEERLQMYRKNAKIMNEANKKLSPERKTEIAHMGQRAGRKGNQQSPNKEEGRLERVLYNHGFTFNYNKEIEFSGYSTLLNRIRLIYPDLVNEDRKIIIENDGWFGHSPHSPYIKPQQKERDNERDDIYRRNGYSIIRVTPKDHELTDEKLLENILNQLLVL